MDSVIAFFKNHSFDMTGLLASLIGGVIVVGNNPQLTFRQAATVVASGIAVNTYLAPLALHLLGLPTAGPIASAAGFISGLIGMKVVVAFNKWADKIENPADFLHPFKDDKK